MKKKPRSYSADFKQEAVRRMAQAKTISGLANELGIRRKFLYQWRHQLEAEGRAGLERRKGRPPGSKSQSVSPPGPSAAELRIAGRENWGRPDGRIGDGLICAIFLRNAKKSRSSGCPSFPPSFPPSDGTITKWTIVGQDGVGQTK